MRGPLSAPQGRHRTVRHADFSRRTLAAMKRAYWTARRTRIGNVGLATVVCAVLVPSVAVLADAAPAGSEVVIRPGQEELLADMLGRGATLPDHCAFAGGQIDRAIVRGVYKCPAGEVTLELVHPSTAPAEAKRTLRFAIVLRSGSPPPGFAAALESRIQSREAAFNWTSPPPAPPPTWLQRNLGTVTLLAATALLVFATIRRVLPRLWPWGRVVLREMLLPLARWLVLGFRGTQHRLGRWRSVAGEWVWRYLARGRQVAQRFRRAPKADMRWLLRDERFWLVVIFVASTVARGWLSIVNTEANDNHLEVADLIRKGGWRQPASSACMECSHAKLYHYALAYAVEVTGRGNSGALLGNLLNFVAGTALLALFFFVFSCNVRYSPLVRVLGLAFLSFNAALVGIFSQATNDGFCILFSSLAIFFLDRFFTDLALWKAVAATVFVILTALSKASGWLMFGCGAGILCVTLVAAAPHLRRQYAVATAVFVLGFLCVVPFANPYRDNLVQTHTPFVNDAFQDPLNKIEVPRAPIAWVWEDLLSFHLFGLMRVPYVDFGDGDASLYRTSLWSQLYGRMFFLRFDQGIWRNMDPRLLSLGRLCLALALLPLAALFVGAATLLRSVRRGTSTRGLRWFAEQHEWQDVVYIGALLAALIALALKYHRFLIAFTWMKAIYLLPVILPLFTLFLDGFEHLWRWRPRLVTTWMLALVIASIADIGWLIHDLMGAGRWH